MEVNIDNWEDKKFPLVEAAKELKSADIAYRKMVKVGVGRFSEYESAWRDFLQCIDRAWNKTQAEAKGKPKWQKLESEYVQLRKKDPLLRYIAEARNVTEHTIDPTIKDWNANLRATTVGNKIKIEWDEWDRPLLPVTNRGTVFNPPKKHLGKPMKHYRRQGVSESRTVAELAMRFYVDMINRVLEEVFINKLSNKSLKRDCHAAPQFKR